MKDSLKSILLAGVSCGVIMGFFVVIISDLKMGFIAAFFFAIFTSFSFMLLILIQSKVSKKNYLNNVGDKKILKEGAANHFKGVESVGGWLYLTTEELIFKSHNFNVQNHKTVILLSQITDIKASLTLGIVPNGLTITAKDSVEKFVVNNRKEWIKKINEAIYLNIED